MKVYVVKVYDPPMGSQSGKDGPWIELPGAVRVLAAQYEPLQNPVLPGMWNLVVAEP